MTAPYREPGEKPAYYEDPEPEEPKTMPRALKNAIYLGLMFQAPVVIGLLSDLSKTQSAHIGLIVGAGVVSACGCAATFILGSWSWPE